MNEVPDDGLTAPIVGPWAEEKYRLVDCYARIFATAMKKKWDARVYIDLFAGAGHARIRGTGRIVETAAIRVLSIPDPFDRYIFSELDPAKLDALRVRIKQKHSDKNTVCLNADSNAEIEQIISLVPPFGPRKKVLTFCFIDPFKSTHLDFRTIRHLAELYVDFLILIPTGMDTGRNEHLHSRAENEVVERFTGRADWRARRAEDRRLAFGDFVALEFGRSMARLGYLSTELFEMKEVTNSKKRGLYRLAMFSRNPLGIDFWEACKKATTQQHRLF